MARIKPQGAVVCDAGPLIHLEELGCLDLLHDFEHVLVPRDVIEEVARHRPAAIKRLQEFVVPAPVVAPASPALFALCQTLVLHKGEVAALQAALGAPGALFLTDDTAARLAARSLGIPVHGSVGIILRAVRRGLRTHAQVLSILQSIPAHSTLHLKPALLDEIVQELQMSAERH